MSVASYYTISVIKQFAMVIVLFFGFLCDIICKIITQDTHRWKSRTIIGRRTQRCHGHVVSGSMSSYTVLRCTVLVNYCSVR